MCLFMASWVCLHGVCEVSSSKEQRQAVKQAERE